MRRLTIYYSSYEDLVEQLQNNLMRAKTAAETHRKIYEGLRNVLIDIKAHPCKYIMQYGAKVVGKSIKIPTPTVVALVTKYTDIIPSEDIFRETVREIDGIALYRDTVIVALGFEPRCGENSVIDTKVLRIFINLAKSKVAIRRYGEVMVPASVVYSEVSKQLPISPKRLTMVLKNHGIMRKRIRIDGRREYVYTTSEDVIKKLTEAAQ